MRHHKKAPFKPRSLASMEKGLQSAPGEWCGDLRLPDAVRFLHLLNLALGHKAFLGRMTQEQRRYVGWMRQGFNQIPQVDPRCDVTIRAVNIKGSGRQQRANELEVSLTSGGVHVIRSRNLPGVGRSLGDPEDDSRLFSMDITDLATFAGATDKYPLPELLLRVLRRLVTAQVLEIRFQGYLNSGSVSILAPGHAVPLKGAAAKVLRLLEEVLVKSHGDDVTWEVVEAVLAA